MLRKIQGKDWPIVKQWLFEIAEVSFDKVIPEILEKKIEEDYKKFPEGFVVSENGGLNGLLWFETFPKKNSAFIHAIYVRSEYRNKGISDKLMDYLEGYCRKQGIKSIELNVTINLESAIKFYERRGFVIKRYNMTKGL